MFKNYKICQKYYKDLWLQITAYKEQMLHGFEHKPK